MTSLSSIRVELRHVLLLTCMALLVVLCLIGQVASVDYPVMFGLAITIVWFLLHKREVLVKYFYFMVVSLWSIVDVFMAETQSLFMPNLQVYSHHTGGLPLLVLSFCVFLLALSFFDTRHSRSSELPRQNNLRAGQDKRHKVSNSYTIVVMFAFIILILCNLDAMRNGFFTSGFTSRYEFNLSSSMLSMRFYSYIQMFIPVVAIYARKSGKSWVIFSFSILYLVYLVLIGNKFGALLLVIYISFISFYIPEIRSKSELDFVSKKVLIAMVALLAALIGYSFLYTLLGTGSVSTAIDQFQDRIFSGQGDVWWGIFANYGSRGIHISELSDELQAFSQEGINQLQYHFAIYKMMDLIAPQQILEIYAARGIRFTMSTDASLFYYFGWIGLLLGKVFLAWLISKLVNALIYTCREGYPLESFFVAVLLSFSMNAANMSEFYLFLTRTAIISYLVLWLSALYRNQNAYVSVLKKGHIGTVFTR